MAYTTRAEMRALNGLGDSAVFSDSDIDAAILIAGETIDDYCGTSFGDLTTPAYESFTCTIDGSGRDRVTLRTDAGVNIMYPRTISSVTIDGVADGVGISYVLRPTGVIVRNTGTFTYDDEGRNIVVSGTAGFTDEPSESIKWAARSLARFWLLSLQSRVPERALQLTTSDGSFEMRAQAGAPGRPSPMPDVNAVLNRNRHGLRVG